MGIGSSGIDTLGSSKAGNFRQQRCSVVRLTIHAVRDRGDPLTLGTQLSELRLYEGSRRVVILAAEAIAPDGPSDHPAAAAIDDNLNTKWVDAGVHQEAGVGIENGQGKPQKYKARGVLWCGEAAHNLTNGRIPA